MKIAMVLRPESPARPSPITEELIGLLSDWGAQVDAICPEEGPICLNADRPTHDLYVLKSGTEGALSFAGALNAAGARMLNSYPAAAILRDKAIVYRTLLWAQIPTPLAYAAHQPGELAPLLEEGPLIIKPNRGSQGRGVHIVRERGDLDRLPAAGEPWIAQRYMVPDGLDQKVYCIGDQVFGVARQWPAKTYRQKLGRPFTVSSELRDIALACGRMFGLEVFGVDVIVSDRRPYVVDVNSFPGFKGVTDAALRLADHIYSCAHGTMRPAAARLSAVR